MIFLRHFLLLLALVSPFGAISGQSKENQIRVVFTVYDWAKHGVGEIYYRNGDEYELIEMRNLSRTEPYVYTGPNHFQIYKKVTQVEEGDPEVSYQVCGETVVEQNGGRVLIVISPQADEGSVFDYQVYALEDSLKTFPANSFRLISFSKKILYFQVDDRKPQGIDPRERITISPDQAGDGYIFVVFRSESGEILYSKKWYSETGVRDLVFLRSFEDRRGKERLGVRIITEYVTDPEEPKRR